MNPLRDFGRMVQKLPACPPLRYSFDCLGFMEFLMNEVQARSANAQIMAAQFDNDFPYSSASFMLSYKNGAIIFYLVQEVDGIPNKFGDGGTMYKVKSKFIAPDTNVIDRDLEKFVVVTNGQWVDKDEVMEVLYNAVRMDDAKYPFGYKEEEE